MMKIVATTSTARTPTAGTPHTRANIYTLGTMFSLDSNKNVVITPIHGKGVILLLSRTFKLGTGVFLSLRLGNCQHPFKLAISVHVQLKTDNVKLHSNLQTQLNFSWFE